MWLPLIESATVIVGGAIALWFLPRSRRLSGPGVEQARARELSGSVMAQVLTPGPTDPPTRPGAGPVTGEAFAQVWAQAERVGWARLVAAGVLRPVAAPAIDPGNPVGARLVLVEHIGGAFGDCRVLLALNPCPDRDGVHELVAIPVPPHFTDAIAAAAWTYDDPDHPVRTTRSTYARLTRRT
jgi:hypothetical protein